MNKLWKAAGAAAWGAVSFGGLLPYLSEEAKERILTLCPQPGGVWVAAFPYFAGRSPGNLPLYCRGEDYHRVLLRRLEAVSAALQEQYPENRFIPGTDNSPIPEQTCARLAGLGERGLHNLLIVPPYGSYVFLGTILTDLPLETTQGERGPICQSCGRCQKACPTGALEGGFSHERCLSHLSQKKGALSQEEEEQLRKSPVIWGCDLCQNACPLNQKAAFTQLPEFRENLLRSLTQEDLEGLTNRQFAERYGDRAFAWRGPAPLRRNLGFKEKKSP
jgi:epoxyqueuosine reductase